jgi:hypothetical protein
VSDTTQSLIDKALERLSEIEAQIAPLAAQIAPLAAKATELKIFVNQACDLSGREKMFADVGSMPGSPSPTLPAALPPTMSFAPDGCVGKPLAPAVRLILEGAKAVAKVGPTSVDDIYSALVQGGFEFPSRDTENQKRGLQVSLSKNTIAFRRLPSGLYGLSEWYGPAPRARKASDGGGNPAATEEAGVSPAAKPHVAENSEGK